VLAAGCDIALYCSGDFATTEALLTTCPALTAEAQARLSAARARVASAQLTLTEALLADERARILA
jgi:beta-N-acetylhexosaminidase